jgi:hypothetical protein
MGGTGGNMNAEDITTHRVTTIAPHPDRRDFLLAAGLGVAAAVVVTGAGRPNHGARGEPVSKAADGYRASPHVMKYYRTAET